MALKRENLNQHNFNQLLNSVNEKFEFSFLFIFLIYLGYHHFQIYSKCNMLILFNKKLIICIAINETE